MPSNTLLEKLARLYKNHSIPHEQLKEVTLAQWMLESGRASSALATEHLNFGGLKWRSEMTPFATPVNYEAHDGADKYCKFPNIESFISGYWAFIGRAPYAGWENHIATGEDYIRFIGSKYTPTPGYADKVLQLVPEARALLASVGTGNGGGPVITPPSLGTIVIDPGHGGTRTVGGSSPNNATSVSGVLEKQLTLDFCLILRDALVELAGNMNKQIKVVMTRTTDKNVGIVKRAQFAATSKANLFLCLHFNGSKNKETRGVETFFRAPENGNMNLAQDIDFATAVNDSLFASLKSIDAEANNRGVKPDTQTEKKRLGVLNDNSLGNAGRPEKCRACYIELEFISNKRVDELLVSGSNASQNKRLVMRNLAATLIEYLEKIS
ncbi:MAG TPA: N-acetylmuramoyl-L-alanine amidase [Pyrinomonadaceae bacterium]|nr:N-acetylmuramoyl-L-alanine amidase [Pyrinomonadaceae bacterium]